MNWVDSLCLCQVCLEILIQPTAQESVQENFQGVTYGDTI